MKFILMLLSVYRITYMIVYESGPLDIFEKLRTFISNKACKESRWTPDDDGKFKRIGIMTENTFWRNIDEGINCEYCVSVWISAIVWLVRRSKLFLGIFGLSGAWMVFNQIMDRIESDDS